MSTGAFIILTTLGALLTAGGIAAWTVQARRGMGVTSLSNHAPWGGYISGFIFFMGLSGGSLIFAAISTLWQTAMAGYSNAAALVAVVALAIGALFVFVDIGRPSKVWRIIRHPNFRSPMVWDLLLTITYFVVGLALLLALLLEAPSKIQTPIAVVALVAGVADGVTAFVFSRVVARDFWHSALQPIAFVAAAIASAGAVIIGIVVIARLGKGPLLFNHGLDLVSFLTALAILLGLLLAVRDALTLRVSKTAKSKRLLRAMVTSRVFQVEIASGVLAMAILFIPRDYTNEALWGFGALLAVIHLALKRIHFVHMGFVVSNIEYAGVDIDRNRGTTVKPVEIAVTSGLIGAFILLATVGLYVLPVWYA